MDETQDIGGQKVYSIADFKNHSDGEWLAIVKKAWGYSEGQAFEVLGRLKEIPTKTGKFYVLEDIRRISDGASLLYPAKIKDGSHTVYIGSINESALSADLLAGEELPSKWVKLRVDLSPKEEREKRENPMALKMVRGSLEILQSVPEELIKSAGGEGHLEKWVLDVYQEKNRAKLVKESNNLQESLEREHEVFKGNVEGKSKKLKEEVETIQSQRESLVDELAKLGDQKSKGSSTLQQLEESILENQVLRTKLETDFNNKKNSMERKLSKLNNFIEQKAEMLLELDLIGQDEFDTLLGKRHDGVKKNGHEFADVFASDLPKAISYVQAFMQNKGIIYRRKVLEDFFALITTHDLIILAGDSGSGKTNLVKSFAEAIGGKAVVVPVKPNWTSAEDLLGYYNPLEKKYLSTPFLDALFEAAKNPNTPYFICLDEMNLARVEYYFADFLSLMEERSQAPEFKLYSDTEASHLVSETRNFLSLIDEAKIKLDKPELEGFLDLLRDEDINAKLHDLCGFREGDSLLKYHGQLRRLMSNYINTPSTMSLPPNVRIIGAINVDETTHYLSPKILDRAHILRFSSPLLTDWDKAEGEVEAFDLDLNLPVNFGMNVLGERSQYPTFDRNDELVSTLVQLVRNYLEPLGVEFGLRTVRQARHYSAALKVFGAGESLILNNIILHKVLPKLMFDGEKQVNESLARKDLLKAMRDYLGQKLANMELVDDNDSCLVELDRVIQNAEANDWVVNYWSR